VAVTGQHSATGDVQQQVKDASVSPTNTAYPGCHGGVCVLRVQGQRQAKVCHLSCHAVAQVAGPQPTRVLAATHQQHTGSLQVTMHHACKTRQATHVKSCCRKFLMEFECSEGTCLARDIGQRTGSNTRANGVALQPGNASAGHGNSQESKS
jgi:hypothetical protein